jgi:transcriptional regulator with XRE-family HTH domain
MTEDYVGARIRRHRRLRGMSLDQAAGLAGIGKPYLSRLERGERSTDSRALLRRIAAALEVSVADLTGQDLAGRKHGHKDVRRAVGLIRLALLDPGAEAPLTSEPSQSIDALLDLATGGDVATQGRLLPDLLRRTQQRACHAPSTSAHRQVVVAAHMATFFLRNVGEVDLAVLAAEAAVAAAQDSEDPATQGLAAFTSAHALAPAGAVRRAAAVAAAGADLRQRPGPEGSAAIGSCMLAAASSNAVLGEFDAAQAQLLTAESVARKLEHPTLVARHTSFSTWNVAMHRVSVEVEQGNPAAALDLAQPVINSPLNHPERMSYLWIDVARALSRLDRHREAVEAVGRAERATPFRVQHCPVAHKIIRDLLDRPLRRASDARLRGLAERSGVLTET